MMGSFYAKPSTVAGNDHASPARLWSRGHCPGVSSRTGAVLSPGEPAGGAVTPGTFRVRWHTGCEGWWGMSFRPAGGIRRSGRASTSDSRVERILPHRLTASSNEANTLAIFNTQQTTRAFEAIQVRNRLSHGEHRLMCVQVARK